jgi:hypothetical protein
MQNYESITDYLNEILNEVLNNNLDNLVFDKDEIVCNQNLLMIDYERRDKLDKRSYKTFIQGPITYSKLISYFDELMKEDYNYGIHTRFSDLKLVEDKVEKNTLIVNVYFERIHEPD